MSDSLVELEEMGFSADDFVGPDYDVHSDFEDINTENELPPNPRRVPRVLSHDELEVARAKDKAENDLNKTQESIPKQKAEDDANGTREPFPKRKSPKQREQETKHRKADSAKIAAGGDFQVQVHVIEGRDLTGKDSGGTSDPVVTISVFDEKKSTKIKSKTNSPRWDQVLIFELNKLEPDQMSHGKVLLEVFDANNVMKNELIGSFEFDLSWIYYREHHEVYNEWIPLMNHHADYSKADTKGIEGIEGYLKLSITIKGPGDEQYIHDEEAELAMESSLESGMILVSPGIEQVECS